MCPMIDRSHLSRAAIELLMLYSLPAVAQVDAFTRERLALEADTNQGSGRITRVLDRLIEERGRPENVRSDNGAEFTSRRMLAWSEERKTMLIHIQPGRPMQNGRIESFHGGLRDECLNASWFCTLNDVRSTLETWSQNYNWQRSHSSLAYRTPAEFGRIAGYENVESKERFPHFHSKSGGCESISKPKPESLAMNG